MILTVILTSPDYLNNEKSGNHFLERSSLPITMIVYKTFIYPKWPNNNLFTYLFIIKQIKSIFDKCWYT